MPDPAENDRPAGSFRHRPTPQRGRRSLGTGRFPRPCGVCGSPSAQTVLIATTGVSLLKDLCEAHLRGLLDGARG